MLLRSCRLVLLHPRRNSEKHTPCVGNSGSLRMAFVRAHSGRLRSSFTAIQSTNAETRRCAELWYRTHNQQYGNGALSAKRISDVHIGSHHLLRRVRSITCRQHVLNITVSRQVYLSISYQDVRPPVFEIWSASAGREPI